MKKDKYIIAVGFDYNEEPYNNLIIVDIVDDEKEALKIATEYEEKEAVDIVKIYESKAIY